MTKFKLIGFVQFNFNKLKVLNEDRILPINILGKGSVFMKYKMFGIPNCDTVKKARMAVEKCKLDYEFVDFKKQPPTIEDIERWEKFYGQLPVNKKGPTFRKIKEAFEGGNRAAQIKLILANPSAIKRPILEDKGKVVAIGFDLEVYGSLKSLS